MEHTSIKINSMTARLHDTGYGGYPYKVVVMVSIDVKEFNKRCPIWKKAKSSPYGRQEAKRDLGNLVLDVNNTVYALNRDIPAHNPSIDSQGGKKAKDGIKTLEFVYFFKDHERAERLGFEMWKIKGNVSPKNYQIIDLMPKLEIKQPDIDMER